jgi:hypothetical protein
MNPALNSPGPTNCSGIDAQVFIECLTYIDAKVIEKW